MSPCRKMLRKHLTRTSDKANAVFSQVKHFGGGVMQAHVYLTMAVTNQNGLAALATAHIKILFFNSALYFLTFFTSFITVPIGCI